MLDEEPRLFFCYFWANDDAVKLAKGLRAALDKDRGGAAVNCSAPIGKAGGIAQQEVKMSGGGRTAACDGAAAVP